MGQSDNSEAWVRAMVPADVPALVDLWVASWQEAMPAIDFDARRDWIAGVLRTPGTSTRVSLDGKNPNGFLTLEDAYLHQLVVAPLAKGRGVATRLLDDAKARSPGGLMLDVNQANARAVRFYAREGFATTAAGRNPASGLPTWTLRWQP